METLDYTPLPLTDLQPLLGGMGPMRVLVCRTVDGTQLPLHAPSLLH
jgi:hypothetical protein